MEAPGGVVWPSVGGAQMFTQAQIGTVQGNTFYCIQGGAVVNSIAGTKSMTLEEVISKLEEYTGVSRAPEFVQIHNEILAIKTKGTGEYFRAGNDIQRWEAGQIAVIWVRGGPGAGKTYMASSFVEWSQELAVREPPGKTAVIYVYMRYDQKLTEYCVVLAVLVQLIQASRHLPDAMSTIRTALEEFSTTSNSRPPLNRLIRLMKDMLDMFRSVRIIFDGVDEMLRELQFPIVEIFAGVPAQIAFFSRPLELLEAATREECTRCGRSIAFVDLVAGAQDLELFITTSIRRTLHLHNLLSKHNRIAQIVRAVIDNANGMFLHAALQMDRLRRCHTIKSVNQALEDFPEKIEDLYHKTLERIFDQDEDSIAQELLMWLLHVRGSMTIDDLIYAVAVSPQSYKLDEDNLLETGDALSMCCGLVVVEAATRQVRFIHYSAYQVLLELLRKRFKGRSTHGDHEYIAQTCLARLEDAGFKNTSMKTLGDLRTAFTNTPFLEYAYNNAGFHIRQTIGNSAIVKTSVEIFILESQCFPYFPNRQPQEHDFEELLILAPIHVATFFGVVHVISDLAARYRHGGDHVDIRSGHSTGLGWTSVMIAAVEGHEDALKLLLNAGADTNLLDFRGRNALHEPAALGNAAVVRTFCNMAKINPNQQNDTGTPPLLAAALKGHVEVVKILLSIPDVDPNLADKAGFSALSSASMAGHRDVVLALIATSGVDCNFPSKSGFTPLALASWKGHRGVVQALLAHRAVDINRQSSLGNSPLIIAAGHGHTTVVRLLVQRRDVQPNLVNNNGDSALFLASVNGYKEVVLLLLTLPNIAVNSPNHSGDTPLTLAAWKGHRSVVEALTAHPGVNVNHRTKAQNSPLTLAAREGHLGIVQLLLGRPELKPDLVNEDGDSALILAATRGHHDLVLALLATPGVDASTMNDTGDTALTVASWKGYHDVVKALLAHGVDVNHQTDIGETPLILAAAGGHVDVVRLLLNSPGIDTTMVDDDGKSALDWAREEGDQEVLDLLFSVWDKS